MQPLERNDLRTQSEGRIAESRLFEQLEILATQLVQHHDVSQSRPEAVQTLAQQVHRVFAGIHHVPIGHRVASFAGHLQHSRFVHPAHQSIVGLGSEIHQDALLWVLDGGFDDQVETLITIHHNGRGEWRVEAQERSVGAIGIESNEREISVDEVLGKNPCDHGLADPALFAADEMNVGHDVIWGGALDDGAIVLSRNNGLFGSVTLRRPVIASSRRGSGDGIPEKPNESHS